MVGRKRPQRAVGSKVARAKHRHRVWKWGTIALCSLAALMIGMGVSTLYTSAFGWHDSLAQSGYYAGKTREEIQEELNRKLEEGMMSVSVRAALYAKVGERDVEVRFQNKASNTMDQRLKLVMTDNEQDVLYYSQAISPNEYIGTITMNRAFETPGAYPVTALVEGYNRATHAHVGDAGAEITLYVSE